MAAQPIETSEFLPDGMARLDFACPLCRRTVSVTVSVAGWTLWRGGAAGSVQEAFPELPAGDRETLVSGCHEACFDAAFADLDMEA